MEKRRKIEIDFDNWSLSFPTYKGKQTLKLDKRHSFLKMFDKDLSKIIAKGYLMIKLYQCLVIPNLHQNTKLESQLQLKFPQVYF